MLTIEVLKQNSVLSGLSDDILSAISEMSKNDENTVIGNKIGALHGQYDADILSVTGVSKKDGEKSYDYAKRVLADYKGKVETLQKQIEKGSNDAELKQQLKDAKALETQLRSQLSEKEKELVNAKSDYDKQLKSVHVDYAFNAATSGLKFKSGITEAVAKTLVNAAKSEVLSKGTPDFVDDGKGGKSLVFRDASGNILTNPANNLNPYSVSELLMSTSIKDVIDTGRKQNGTGTSATTTPAGNSAGTFDLSGVRTQVEADKAIEAHLLANGLTRDSSEFSDKLMQIRTENNVSELPIR